MPHPFRSLLVASTLGVFVGFALGGDDPPREGPAKRGAEGDEDVFDHQRFCATISAKTQVRTGGNAAAQPAKLTAKDIPHASQGAAVAAIERLGGRVTFDTKSRDRPATGVRLFGPEFVDAHLMHLKALTSLQSLDLTNSKVTDAGLAHLKGLTRLQVLNLSGTQVTDAGLVHLKGLTSLKRLDLTYTRITGAGLAHVEGLTSLKTLALGYTKITDPRLEHLFGLTKLQTLYLTNTKVTGAGVKALRRALPQCNTDVAN